MTAAILAYRLRSSMVGPPGTDGSLAQQVGCWRNRWVAYKALL